MWPIQIKLLSPSSVVDDDSETARCCDDEFLSYLVGMPAPCGPGWDIVQVVCPFERKRDVTVSLNERQVASVVHDLWEIDNSYGLFLHRACLWGYGPDW